MSKTYKTSKENRKILTEITRILSLGHENHIGRIGIMMSVSNSEGIDLENITLKDSGGKEYSNRVLFGDYESIYKEVIAYAHQIASSDPKLDSYIKYHLDRGIELIGKSIIDEQSIVSLEEFVEQHCL